MSAFVKTFRNTLSNLWRFINTSYVNKGVKSFNDANKKFKCFNGVNKDTVVVEPGSFK